jgi:hypothetical protein
MRQADKPVAVRVAPREQGPARRRAQRRGGVRAGEHDALGRELVEPRADHVGVAVDTEVTAEVVPVHDQHVVFPRVGHQDPFVVVGTPNRSIAGRASI